MSYHCGNVLSRRNRDVMNPWEEPKLVKFLMRHPLLHVDDHRAAEQQVFELIRVANGRRVEEVPGNREPNSAFKTRLSPGDFPKLPKSVGASRRAAGPTCWIRGPGNRRRYSIHISLFCEYIHLEYVRIHVIYRVYQAEHGIHILVVTPQEYVNIYSTRRQQILEPVRVSDGRRVEEVPGNNDRKFGLKNVFHPGTFPALDLWYGCRPSPRVVSPCELKPNRTEMNAR